MLICELQQRDLPFPRETLFPPVLLLHPPRTYYAGRVNTVRTFVGPSLPYCYILGRSYMEDSAVHTAPVRAKMRCRSSRLIPFCRPTISRGGLTSSSSDCRIQESVDSQSVGNPVPRYYIWIASKRDNFTRAHVDCSCSGMIDFVETWMSIGKGS